MPQATAQPGHPARCEPLLWLQLLGLAALPLEAVLLVLVLGGADPGPWPALERLLAWALGGLGSAFLFWRLPPDLWSLLLLQVPLRGRRPDQLRLSALQGALPLKLLTSAGVALSLPLIWWADSAAGLAWSWSPLAGSSRLVGLLAAALVLALLQWQWHQLVQALWMVSRRSELVAATMPLSQAEAAERRLILGLPLLLLAPLQLDPQPPAAPSPGRAATGGAAAPVQATVPEAAQPQGQSTDLAAEAPALSQPEAPSELDEPSDPEEASELEASSQSIATAEPAEGQEPHDPVAAEEPGQADGPGEAIPSPEAVEPDSLREPMEAVELDQASEAAVDPGPSTKPEPAPLPEVTGASAPLAAAPVDLPVSDPSPIDGTAAILPEQHPEQAEGTDLDQQV
ncbi:low-complexity tail membrane protein [Synechococcus sp. GreenBA-s]|nr:low-complexity tail membrane protein [Synechococcus sp. GreenBA-s]